jgi:large subunit ribosomal protein L20
MNRASNTPATRHRRKKILKQAKGYFGSKHKLFKTAKEQVMHSLVYSYRDRKQKKRFFRSDVWISRLNIALRNEWKEKGLNYSRFIHLKNLAQIKLDRKQLSEMAINEPQSFGALIDKIKNPW